MAKFTVEQAQAEAERFLVNYGGLLLAASKKHPESEDSTKRLRAFSRLRRYWGKKIIAAFDES